MKCKGKSLLYLLHQIRNEYIRNICRTSMESLQKIIEPCRFIIPVGGKSFWPAPDTYTLLRPMTSWQKGRLEKNHEFIRYILPKGRPFTTLTKVQVITMMNHINSTARASLNGRTSLRLPDALLKWSGAAAIPHDEVLLKPRLLKMPQP